MDAKTLTHTNVYQIETQWAYNACGR